MILKRIKYTKNGVYGILFDDNENYLLLTMELPWKNNLKNISCIPSGTYKIKKIFSKDFGAVYLIKGVPGRSGILIHNGNTMNNTHGCILIGDSFGKLNSLPAVLNSKKTLKKFMSKKINNLELTITD